jgi:hypothetical protein
MGNHTPTFKHLPETMPARDIDGAIDIAKTEADIKGFGALVGLRYHF